MSADVHIPVDETVRVDGGVSFALGIFVTMNWVCLSTIAAILLAAGAFERASALGLVGAWSVGSVVTAASFVVPPARARRLRARGAANGTRSWAVAGSTVAELSDRADGAARSEHSRGVGGVLRSGRGWMSVGGGAISVCAARSTSVAVFRIALSDILRIEIVRAAEHPRIGSALAVETSTVRLEVALLAGAASLVGRAATRTLREAAQAITAEAIADRRSR